ncbi:MAG: Sel1 protein [uncultured bacterium]|nr:MAG: Sel1 protein [uncultured bacterium]
MKKLSMLVLLTSLLSLNVLADLTKAEDAFRKEDYVTAHKEFMQEADCGNDIAQMRLGWMYKKGIGVNKDLILAHMWYDLSSSNGAEKVLEAKEQLAKQMTPQQVEQAKKMANEWKSKHSTNS